MSEAAAIGWTLSDVEAWECRLPGARLWVSDLENDGPTDDDPCDWDDLPESMEEADHQADLTLLPWVWRAFRVVDRFTEVELESGRAPTRDEAMAAAEGVNADTDTVVSEVPYEAIIDAADRHGCDLIFMASHGRRGIAGLLLGSETQKVLTHSNIPVLVYR